MPLSSPHWSPFNNPNSIAQVRALLEWIACDLVSGDKVAYMPGTEGSISRALGAYTSSTLTIPAPLVGNLAMGGLLNQAVGPDELPTRMMVALVNDRPAWAGIIWKVRGGSDGLVELGCATPESYLDRRYVGDVSYSNLDLATIAANLARLTNTEGINLDIDAIPSGPRNRSRTYWDDEDATYYQRLQELMDVDGGPEWTIDPDWRSFKQQSVRLIFKVRDRIGSTTPRGPLSTDAESVTGYSVSYDYGKGMGANDAFTYSSGEGEDRPHSLHYRNEIALASGVPRVENRRSPSSSIKDPLVLNGHAKSDLARLDGGTTTIDVTARWDVFPARLGIDLDLGDDTEFAMTGHMHPTGIYGIGRLIGWKFNTEKAEFIPTLRL